MVKEGNKKAQKNNYIHGIAVTIGWDWDRKLLWQQEQQKTQHF